MDRIFHIKCLDREIIKSKNYMYITAATMKNAISTAYYIVAEDIQKSSEMLHFQECYERAEKYRYKIREIITDGHGNIKKTDWINWEN